MSKDSTFETMKLMLNNELKSVEMGTLLRNYATPEELATVEQIINECKRRQKSQGINTVGTLINEFFKISDAKKKITP